LDVIKQAFAQTGLQLLAAITVAMFSLYLLYKQTCQASPFQLEKFLQTVDDLFVRFDWTPTEVLRLFVKVLLIICSLKRRSLLGWGDLTISLGVFSLAIPTVLDLLVALVQLAVLRGG